MAQEDQARVLARLANQDRLYLAFYGDDFNHRFTKIIAHDEQQWQYLDELVAEAVHCWDQIPPEQRDLGRAKAEFMARFVKVGMISCSYMQEQDRYHMAVTAAETTVNLWKGVDDYAEVPDPQGRFNLDAFSIGLWVMPAKDKVSSGWASWTYLNPLMRAACVKVTVPCTWVTSLELHRLALCPLTVAWTTCASIPEPSRARRSRRCTPPEGGFRLPCGAEFVSEREYHQSPWYLARVLQSKTSAEKLYALTATCEADANMFEAGAYTSKLYSWWRDFKTVALVGDYAYVAAGDGFVVLVTKNKLSTPLIVS